MCKITFETPKLEYMLYPWRVVIIVIISFQMVIRARFLLHSLFSQKKSLYKPNHSWLFDKSLIFTYSVFSAIFTEFFFSAQWSISNFETVIVLVALKHWLRLDIEVYWLNCEILIREKFHQFHFLLAWIFASSQLDPGLILHNKLLKHVLAKYFT